MHELLILTHAAATYFFDDANMPEVVKTVVETKYGGQYYYIKSGSQEKIDIYERAFDMGLHDANGQHVEYITEKSVIKEFKNLLNLKLKVSGRKIRETIL